MSLQSNLDDINKVEEGDLILIKNHSLFNQSFVECVVERRVIDNILKLKWKYDNSEEYGNKYVDFDCPYQAVTFIKILEKKVK